MSLHMFIERVRAYGIRPENRRKITAHQMYPWAIERQFQQDLLTQFRNAGTFYEQQALKDTWSFNDTVDDLTRSEYVNDTELSSIARRVSYEVEYFQQQCFENFTETVIGARYIPTVVAPTITDTWEKNFMTLCRSTNDEMKKKVSAIVSDAVMNGNNIADTRKQIQEAVATFSKSKANLIARTETAKLNMAISKAQMEEAGVEYYEWACMLDERTRQSHAKMDGKICIWNNPNVVYDLKTHKTKPRAQSAVHLHPGDDYNCRCIALPWDPLIEKELNQKKGKPNKEWIELKEKEKQEAEAKRLDRIKLKNVPFIGEKISSLVENILSAKDYSSALQQEATSIIKYKAISKTELSASAKDKLFAIEKDFQPVAKKNNWYYYNDKKLEFSLNDNMGKNVEGQTNGLHGMSLPSKTVNEFFSALKKFENGNKDLLNIDEANAVVVVWHELNHLMDPRKHSGILSTNQRKFLELANEFKTRHTADFFLKALNGLNYENSVMVHSQNVLKISAYNKSVSKLEILVQKYGLNPYSFSCNLNELIMQTDINSRDFAIRHVFDMMKKPSDIELPLNDLIDKLIDESVSLADFETYVNL